MELKDLIKLNDLLVEYWNAETCYGHFPKWKDRHIEKVHNRLIKQIDEQISEKIKLKVLRDEVK